MQTKSSATNKKMPGETLAVVLDWSAWCLIGLTILIFLISSVTTSYPTTLSPLQIVLYQVRSVTYVVFTAFVLFGISAIIKATNANTLEIRKLRSDSKQ